VLPASRRVTAVNAGSAGTQQQDAAMSSHTALTWLGPAARALLACGCVVLAVLCAAIQCLRRRTGLQERLQDASWFCTLSAEVELLCPSLGGDPCLLAWVPCSKSCGTVPLPLWVVRLLLAPRLPPPGPPLFFLAHLSLALVTFLLFPVWPPSLCIHRLMVPDGRYAVSTVFANGSPLESARRDAASASAP